MTSEVVTEDTAVGSVLAQHRVLATFFKLKSKAFMLTFNDPGITVGTWTSFLDFVKGLAKTWGARAWAAGTKKTFRALYTVL